MKRNAYGVGRIVFSLALLMIILPVIAFAIGTPHAGGTPSGSTIDLRTLNPLNCEDIPCVVQALIGALFWISVPVTTIMVLVGGFQILTAAGNPEKFKSGRNTIIYAVVGFAIILVSLGIVDLIRSIIR